MARLLNGGSDRIATSVAFGPSNVFSCCAWFYASSLRSYNTIIHGGNFEGLRLSGASGNPLTYTWNNTSDEYDAATGLTVSTGVWHFCALVVTPTAATVYLDGNSWTNTKSHNSVSITWSNIGCDPAAGDGRTWQGSIAEVPYWTASLTANEIAGLAKGARARRVRSASVFAYWPLFGKLSPEPDLSGNKNNATLTGTSGSNHPPVKLFTPNMRSDTTSGITRTQGNFRFRNDDGSESTATWAAAGNTNTNVAKLTNRRLRIQTDTTGDAPSEALKLQARRIGDTAWTDVVKADGSH